MAKNPINTRVQLKHDTEANWNTAGQAGFVPLVGEVIIYDPDTLYDYPRIKIGNGSTGVHLLPFIDKALWDQITAMDSITAVDDGDCNITLGLSPLPSSEEEEY